MTFRLKLTILVFFLSFSLFSQDTTGFNCTGPNKPYFKSYLDDSWNIVNAPARWKAKEWIAVALAGGTWIAVYSQDSEIRDIFQRNRTVTTDNFSKYFSDPLGKGYYILPFLGFTYIYGVCNNNQTSRTIALDGIKVYILSGIFSQAIKQISHRHRPYQDDPPDPRLWDGPFSDFRYTSFPSGHTTVAFAMASYFSAIFCDRTWVPLVCYTTATLVGLSRLNDDKHWASDIIAGAALGYLIGRVVYKTDSNKKGISLNPAIISGGIGIAATWDLSRSRR